MTYRLSEAEVKETKEFIGRLGEQIVAEHFMSENVVMSSNKYDSEKDMTIGGQTTEVKTLQEIRKCGEFWVNGNQLSKMRSVDRLYYVEIPWINESPVIKIYRCTKNSKLITNKRYTRGSFKDIVAVSKSRLELVAEVKDEPRAKELMDLSTKLSKYRRDGTGYSK